MLIKMITSISNVQVKNVIKLKNKAKVRREQDCFLAEGIKMSLEAPVSRVLKTYVSESLYETEGRRFEERGISVEVVSDKVFAEMSDTVTPQGVITVVKRETVRPDEMISRGKCFVLLENIQDPGNLGTMIRTAEAAGVDAIFISADAVDPYNPKVIRSTMGAIYRVPVIIEEDLRQIVDRLQAAEVRCYAAYLTGSVPYDEPDYSSPCAFLIGNEANGLTAELAEAADAAVRIPMCGQVESLNAAVAMSVLCYEAFRQKRHQTQRNG